LENLRSEHTSSSFDVLLMRSPHLPLAYVCIQYHSNKYHSSNVTSIVSLFLPPCTLRPMSSPTAHSRSSSHPVSSCLRSSIWLLRKPRKMLLHLVAELQGIGVPPKVVSWAHRKLWVGLHLSDCTSTIYTLRDPQAPNMRGDRQWKNTVYCSRNEYISWYSSSVASTYFFS